MDTNYFTGWISMQSLADNFKNIERIQDDKRKINFENFEGLYFSKEKNKCYTFNYKSEDDFNGEFTEIKTYDITCVDPFIITDNKDYYIISNIDETNSINISNDFLKYKKYYFQIPAENLSEINEIRQKFEHYLS